MTKKLGKYACKYALKTAEYDPEIQNITLCTKLGNSLKLYIFSFPSYWSCYTIYTCILPYTVNTIGPYTFKMIQMTNVAYLEFHIHTSQ
jgi:hypothetical protein